MTDRQIVMLMTAILMAGDHDIDMTMEESIDCAQAIFNSVVEPNVDAERSHSDKKKRKDGLRRGRKHLIEHRTGSIG